MVLLGGGLCIALSKPVWNKNKVTSSVLLNENDTGRVTDKCDMNQFYECDNIVIICSK